MEFGHLVFIGRFQPFHSGHFAIVQEALKHTENLIIVLGSHNEARSARNPLTSAERIQVISSTLSVAGIDLSKIFFLPQENYLYNDQKWIASITGGVNSIIWRKFNPGPMDPIGLVGRKKDDSSYYLQFFPHWGHVDVPDSVTHDIDATDIRHCYYDCINAGQSSFHMPNQWFVNNTHQTVVTDWFTTPAVRECAAEFKYIEEYKSKWAKVPYPPIFSTVDAVVVQSGHILLVRRGAMPGKGSLALPGGFVNQNEFLEDSMIRELKEETKIKMPDAILRGRIQLRKVYDNPYRSQRGRVITHAYYIKLEDKVELPKVRGGDDAAKAFWKPLGELKKDEFFEDHYDIIDDIVGVIRDDRKLSTMRIR